MLPLLLALLLFTPVSTKAADEFSMRGATILPGNSYAKLSPLYGKRYAVVVGIDKYANATHKFPDLQGAVSDANLVEKAFQTIGFDQVVTLRNAQATKARIIETLGDEVGMKATENDLIVFFFAGHGDTRGHAADQMGFVLPADYDPQKHMATSISMSTLRDVSRQIQAKHVLYVMDSCFSGGILQSRAPLVEIPVEGTLRYVQGLLERPAHVVITAGGQSDFANEEGGRGLFTKLFIEGLEGMADRQKRGIITASGLALYIQEKMPDLLPPGVRQNPQYGRLLGESDVVLSVVLTIHPKSTIADVEALEGDKARLEQEFEQKQTRQKTEFEREMEKASHSQKNQLEEKFLHRKAQDKAEFVQRMAVLNERLAMERRLAQERQEAEIAAQRAKLEQEFLARQVQERQKAKEEYEKMSRREQAVLKQEFEQRQAQEKAAYERRATEERQALVRERMLAQQELQRALEERRKAEELKRDLEASEPTGRKPARSTEFYSPAF